MKAPPKPGCCSDASTLPSPSVPIRDTASFWGHVSRFKIVAVNLCAPLIPELSPAQKHLAPSASRIAPDQILESGDLTPFTPPFSPHWSPLTAKSYGPSASSLPRPRRNRRGYRGNYRARDERNRVRLPDTQNVAALATTWPQRDFLPSPGHAVAGAATRAATGRVMNATACDFQPRKT